MHDDRRTRSEPPMPRDRGLLAADIIEPPMSRADHMSVPAMLWEAAPTSTPADSEGEMELFGPTPEHTPRRLFYFVG